MNTECLEATFDSFAAFGSGETRPTPHASGTAPQVLPCKA